jgi:protein-tyrosine phosphatase
MSFWQKIRQVISINPLPTTLNEAEPCFWQVDMHSHLVPNVDDGVSNSDQALICMKQLADWGIKKIITTPHISRDWYPNESGRLRAEQTALQAIADDNKLDLTIEVAAEYLLDEFFPALLAADDLLSFGSARYLLFELGWAAAPHQVDDVLFRLKTRGYTPVLAHPERYSYYYDDPYPLEHLHELGCLFQINA